MTTTDPCPSCGRRRVCPDCRRAAMHALPSAPEVPTAAATELEAPTVADGPDYGPDAYAATMARWKAAGVLEPVGDAPAPTFLVDLEPAGDPGPYSPQPEQGTPQDVTPVPMETDPAALVAAFGDLAEQMAVHLAAIGTLALERRQVVRQLTMGRSKVEAARLLGISLSTLYKHLVRDKAES